MKIVISLKVKNKSTNFRETNFSNNFLRDALLIIASENSLPINMCVRFGLIGKLIFLNERDFRYLFERNWGVLLFSTKINIFKILKSFALHKLAFAILSPD